MEVANPLKTNVQLLNERCVKGGIPSPIYEIEQKQILPPTLFHCTCTLKMNGRTYVAMGEGQKKKDAMQSASKSMFMDHLKISNEDQGGFNALVGSAVNIGVEQGFENRENVDGNLKEEEMIENCPLANVGDPVGELEKYCKKYWLPIPEYDMKAPIGPSHCPVLTVSCKVGHLMLEGRSKTRKAAKRIAAYKIMQHLKKYLVENGNFKNFGETMDKSYLHQLSFLEGGEIYTTWKEKKNGKICSLVYGWCVCMYIKFKSFFTGLSVVKRLKHS